MPSFLTRAASNADLQLTFEITKDAMLGYVEQTWGAWNEEEQREKHQQNFVPETHRILLVNNAEAGLLVTELEPEYVWLVKLHLFGQFRNQGLGSAVLQQVIEEANELGKSVRLRVLRVNTAAQRLYARHGFQVVGEEPERIFMVRQHGDA